MDIIFNIAVLLKQSSWVSLDWWGFYLLSCQFADMVRLPIIQLETDAVGVFLIDMVWKGRMNFSLSPVFFLELWSHPVAVCAPMKPMKKWGDWWDSKSYCSTETFGKRMKCWSWQRKSHRIRAQVRRKRTAAPYCQDLGKTSQRLFVFALKCKSHSFTWFHKQSCASRHHPW